MDIFDKDNIGKFLTIAGAVVTLLGSLIESQQRAQENHLIAQDVAAMVCDELKRRQ